MSALTDLFRAVLDSSWESALVILLILLVRPLMGSGIPARWRYLLWTLALLRLLVPISLFPPSPVSLQNVPGIDRPVEQVELALPPSLPPEIPRFEGAVPAANPGVPETPLPPPLRSISVLTVGALVWAAGVVVSLTVIAIAQMRLRRQLRLSREQVDPDVEAVWDRCCQRLAMKRRPLLRALPQVSSPALVGVWRPVLLIPSARVALSRQDWENIFVHELAHYRSADHWLNAVQLFARALHWFNPMVWIGFRQLRVDRELAADEWTLRHLRPGESTGYGDTLLKMVAASSARTFAPSTIGIAEDRSQLRDRLRRIVTFGPRTILGSIFGGAIVIAIACLALGRQVEKPDLSSYADLKPDEILVSSARRGDLPVMRFMLGQGVDRNAVADVDGRNTPLSAAVAANQQEAMRLLVEKGADVNREVPGVWSPLKAALETGRTECAMFLIAHGATISQARMAALTGDMPHLKAILDANQLDAGELKFLCAVAASNGQTDAFRLLTLKVKTMPGESNWTLDDRHVLFTIARGHRDTVQAILDESPFMEKLNKGGVMRIGPALEENPGMRDWLTSKGFTIPPYTNGERLIDATEHEDLPEMKRLLDAGTDVNYRGESSWTPITKAAAWNKVRSIKFLLAHGADPNSVHLPGWDYTPICLTSKPEIADMVLAAGGNINATLYKRNVHIMDYSVTFGQTAMVKWYIAHGVDPTKVQADGPDMTFLFDAGNADIATILIQHGVNVKAKNKGGETALHQICMFGKKPAEIAAVLLKNGADPNARDNYGVTPLMRAKDGATVDVLVQYGADVHAKTKDGGSLLAEGGAYSDPTWMAALIRHGATFDIKTDGPAQLVRAAWMNRVDVMLALLNAGVDPNLEGAWNKAAHAYMTPLTAAVVDGQYDAAKLLVEHGARIDQQVMSDALGNRRVAIIKLFWEHDAHFISPLTYAVTQGASVEELKKQVDGGASIQPAKGEVSPLAEAALLGNLPAVQFLVERGAKPAVGSAPDVNLGVALDNAASEGQDEIVTYLLQHGAHAGYGTVIEAATNATPYADERSKDHFEKTISILIDAGALKGIAPQDAATVLQSAIFTRQGPGNEVVVKALLKAGLSLDAKGKDGKSVIQVARENSARSKGEYPAKDLMALLEQADKK